MILIGQTHKVEMFPCQEANIFRGMKMVRKDKHVGLCICLYENERERERQREVPPKKEDGLGQALHSFGKSKE